MTRSKQLESETKKSIRQETRFQDSSAKKKGADKPKEGWRKRRQKATIPGTQGSADGKRLLEEGRSKQNRELESQDGKRPDSKIAREERKADRSKETRQNQKG
jgi:hypothetical protein